jgi:5-methylcytosine-specific restriction endonuclease McrA
MFNKNKNNKDGLDNKCRICNKISSKLWADNNRELKREKDREYYRNNSGIQLERASKWRADNKDTVISYRKQKTEDGYFSNKQHERRSRANYTDSDVSIGYIRNLKNKHTECFWCDKSLEDKDKTIDHLHPIAKGGQHITTNLVIACRSCNSKKRVTMPEEFAKRVGVDLDKKLIRYWEV